MGGRFAVQERGERGSLYDEEVFFSRKTTVSIRYNSTLNLFHISKFP
jgi:hypothetical protein